MRCETFYTVDDAHGCVYHTIRGCERGFHERLTLNERFPHYTIADDGRSFRRGKDGFAVRSVGSDRGCVLSVSRRALHIHDDYKDDDDCRQGRT